MNLEDFIKQQGITIDATPASENPHMDTDSHWEADHWKCLLAVQDSTNEPFEIYFSKGKGHDGREPEASEVLDSLASDASGYENARSFEEWADEYGFDTDSRKAEATFRTVGKQAAALKALLGDEAYDALLWHTERL